MIVWLILPDFAPAPPRVLLGPPQQALTQHPTVCAHTRLTDEVEEWKIQRTLSLAREMGAGTIVEFFPWPYAEKEHGVYDWSHFDRIIRHAENQGLAVIARLGLVPWWARPPVYEKVTTLQYLPYNNFHLFEEYVEAFVRRYGDRIWGVIIWNEPNLTGEWGDRPVDPEAYTELLRVSYAAARRANPAVLVLGGALAPTLEPDEGGAGGMNELRYLERMYEAGAAEYMDALAAHTYGFTHPASQAPDPATINFRRIELLRAIMERYGEGDMPVFITESGWSDDPLWTRGVRPAQRIQYTIEAFEMVEAWPWADILCVWVFRQPDDSVRRDRYYALVSADFHLKPIYKAIQAYALGWESPYLP